MEELRIGNMILRSPFKNGKNGIQKIMHNSFKAKETSITVRVRRGSESDDELFTELQVRIEYLLSIYKFRKIGNIFILYYIILCLN